MNIKKLLISFTFLLLVTKMYSATLFLENTSNQTNYLGCTSGETPSLILNIGTSVPEWRNVLIKWYKRVGTNSIPVMDDIIGSRGDGSSATHDGVFKLMFLSDGLTVEEKGPFARRLLRNHPSNSNCFLTEGLFYAVITLEEITGSGHPDYQTNDFNFVKGYSPTFSLNNIVDLNSNKRNDITLFSGCDNGDIILKLSNTQTCATDAFRLVITKKDINGSYIGNSYNRTLTSTEINNIKGTAAPGISIKTLTDATYGTITITPDNWYVIELIYVGQSVYKPQRVSLHYKSGSWDLVMTDNNISPTTLAGYKGYEPTFKYDDDIYRSPDLWNKLSNTTSPTDGVNENPDHIPTTSTSGNTNKMLVKVTNIGCTQSPAGVPLRLYWTRARTDELYANYWLFSPTNIVYSQNLIADVPAGSEITISSPSAATPYNASSSPYTGLPAINPGVTFTLPFANGIDWFPPNPLGFDFLNGHTAQNIHPIICFLARINEKTSTNDPIIWEPTSTIDKISPYVKNNNNVATRNAWLVDDPNFLIVHTTTNTYDYGFGTVLVNNPGLTPSTVNICVDLMPDVSTVGTFTNHGTIDIGTTTGLYNLWVLGGQLTSNASLVSPTSFLVNSGTHACLNNITLPAGASEQIGLRFNYNSGMLPSSPRSYNYQLSQYSVVNDDTIISSEDTIRGSNTVYIVNVASEAPGLPSNLTAGMNDVKPKMENLILYPNPSNNMVSISMFNQNEGSTVLKIADSRGVLVKTYTYTTTGAFIETIDTSLLPSGIYLVSFHNNNTIETKKLTIIH